jgi:selenocysteine-specific elongation factor
VILGTAGHIDHGKTTLIRVLTGVDTDRLPEEKRRGITIELGFAPLVLDGVGTIGVVDVPGHEAFVRTMVAGASGVDIALVVVAADEGVMPQTREHLAILELLGVNAGVVALTKVDLVDDEWLALVAEEVRAATHRALPDAAIVATSATTGQGIAELRAALTALAQSIPVRAVDDIFRLPVDRAFTIRGTGTVVTGTVWSGSVARDETVRILPSGNVARVRTVQGHGHTLDAAAPGARTAVALAGVDVADVRRGSTLVTDSDWHPTTIALADVVLAPGVDVALRPRSWFRLHVGTSEVGARIVATWDMANSRRAGARIMFDEPVVLRAGDRFVVRTSAPLNTVAGGVIVDPYAAKRARPWPPDLDVPARLSRLVHESGSQGILVASLPVRLGASTAECRRLIRAASDLFVQTPTRLVSRATFAEMESELVRITTEYQDSHTLELGIPSPLLRSRVRGAPEVVELALVSRQAAGVLVSAAGLISLAGWHPTPTPEQRVIAETILATLVAAGVEPPTIDELIEDLPQSPAGDIAAIVRFLERTGQVVQVEQNRYYATDQLKSLVERLRSVLLGKGEVSPSGIRDALGLSRKFLIPFLEYCDRVGHTSRGVNGRVWAGS